MYQLQEVKIGEFDAKNIKTRKESAHFVIYKKLKDCQTMNEVPFIVSKHGIVFEVKIDRGTRHLVLDTGSTVTALLPSTDVDQSLLNKRYNLPTFTS